MTPRPLPPLPDARPHTAPSDRTHIDGWRCRTCAHAIALPAPWCPKCRGELEAVSFGPEGTVWSSTVFRVPLEGRTPPWTLAYIDIDDGPRVLAHVRGSAERLAVGSRAALVGESAEGDLLVEGIAL